MGRYGAVVGSGLVIRIHVTWAPVLGLPVEPRWGGESFYLLSTTRMHTYTYHPPPPPHTHTRQRPTATNGRCDGAATAGALGAATVRRLTDDDHYDGARGVAPLLKRTLHIPSQKVDTMRHPPMSAAVKI